MEDHREKDKRVEEDAMRRFFSSQPTGFICPILNGPCSTMTEAEEIEAELHTRIKELEAQLTAAEEVAQYADYVIRNVVHGTPYDDALDIYIQKKVAYRNTYGKGE